jgi:hypothetical protein
MARPAYRNRRGREEEEEDDRRGRGRGPAPRKASGPPPAVLFGGLAFVAVAIVVGVIAAKSKKAPPPPPPPPPLRVVQKNPEPPKSGPPPKAAPKPLTTEEKAFIEGLFAKAQPHVDLFRKHVKAGWDLKNKGDNDASNEAWIDAKKEFHKALEIVVEVTEDEDRFPAERPGMSFFNSRVAGWQKELSDLPKVNVTR